MSGAPGPDVPPGGGPLAGVRVLELAALGAAPFACMLLAEFGAEVIRIDRPGGAGLPQAPDDALHRSRPNLALDLKAPGAREVMLRLAADADVVVEGWRPGVAERLGVGPEDCRGVNPRLVYGRMTGWGQHGPLAARAGHDLNYAGLSGALHASGEAGKPRQAVNLVADFGGGSMFLVAGVLAALIERERSGEGQVIDAAMVDGAASLLTMVYAMHAHGRWADRREANLLDGGTPFYDTYRCRDGRHLSVAAIEPAFFAALTERLGVSFEQHDRDAWPAMRRAFEQIFLSRDRDDWVAEFDGIDACVFPVLGLEEAPRHPHLRARGSFSPLANGFEPRIGPRFSRTPARAPGSVRATGRDSRDILRAHGFDERQVERLIRDGAVLEG